MIPAVMFVSSMVHDTDLLSWISAVWFMILTRCHGFQMNGVLYWPAAMCFSSMVYDSDLLSCVSAAWFMIPPCSHGFLQCSFMILTHCHEFQQCGL